MALRLFLAALLGTLIGSSIFLLILIRNERARDNARLVARGVEEDGAREEGLVGATGSWECSEYVCVLGLDGGEPKRRRWQVRRR